MAKGQQMLQWDQTSLVCFLIANANRDPKARPKPYLPSDFHPYRTAEEYETEESGEPDWNLWSMIRKQHKVTKLNGNGKNQGRRSVPPSSN